LVFVILNLSSAFLCREFFDTQQSLCRVSENVLIKESFADKMFTEYSSPIVKWLLLNVWVTRQRR
jgi:hypothetical protein